VALSALEQCALTALARGVEEKAERRFEPIRDLMLVRAQWQVGRDDGDDRRDYETGDGPVILDRPNDIGRDGVEAELLVRLAQRGGNGVFAGIDPAAREGDLAGMRPQRVAANGQDHSGIRSVGDRDQHCRRGRRLGAELGFEVIVGSAAVPPELFPPGVRVTTDAPTALAGADATTYVVVGTMGAGDEAALAAAAASEAPYVGLVASRKKARFLIDYVRADGVAADRLARVKFPAGLDLGGMSASEIALSVLAEIIQRRYAKPNVGSSPPSAASSAPTPLQRNEGARTAAPAMARDPICGMPVDTSTARYTVVEGDETRYFCCPGCRATYLRRRAESAK